MAIVNVQNEATVRKWPSAPVTEAGLPASQVERIPIQGTVNPKTLKPEMTVTLPGGKSITGDINYWNSIKGAGGVPGLNPEQSYYMTQLLTQPDQTIRVGSDNFPVKLKGFTALKENFSSVDEALKQAEREGTVPGSKTTTETVTQPDGTKTTTTNVTNVTDGRNPASESNPTPQPSTLNATPGDNADKKQLAGSADDDQNPNKQNSVDGTNQGVKVEKDEFGLPIGTIIDPTGWGPSAGNSDNQTSDAANKPIVSRRTYNPLAQLSSYSYILTLYMISPDAYQAFIDSGRKKIDALSKATPVGEGSPSPGGAIIVARTGGNNSSDRIGNMDYFIDNLRMKSAISTKTTGLPLASVSEITFTISEPYGFRFITDLKRAVTKLQSQSGSESYKKMTSFINQFFILGIKYYGYDADGNLVKGTDKLYGNMIDPLGGDGLFENFYDIQIRSFRFRLSGDTVNYNIEASVPIVKNVEGIKRGRLTEGANIQGKTVQDILTGEKGLFTILNKKEENRVKNNNQKYPNKYSVVFMGEAEKLIKNAPLVTINDINKARAGEKISKTVDSNDIQSDVPPDLTSRSLTINTDTSIISAIETVIKTSTYITNALNTLYANQYEPNPKQKNYEQNEQEPTTLRWFTVTSDIKKIDWDDKVNDWAFEIVYIIQVYEIPSIETPYYSQVSKYRGPHKRYDYWLTGQNSEVLDLDFTLDSTYFLSVTGFPKSNSSSTAPSTPGGRETDTGQRPSTGPAAGNGNNTSNASGLKQDSPAGTNPNDPAQKATNGGEFSAKPGALTNADRTTALGVGREAENSVATYLYDPAAFASANLQIIGDPDFIVRDSSTTLNSLYNIFYNTDGFTPNANGGQVFVEIGFKEGVDYRDSDGLLNINDNILFSTYPDYIKKICGNRIIYKVVQVDSLFSRGRFVQNLSLIQPTFPNNQPSTPKSATPDELQEVQITARKKNEQTVNDPTKGTNTANDDALQEVKITASKKSEGREPQSLANKTDAELFNMGYMPDEFEKVRNGGG